MSKRKHPSLRAQLPSTQPNPSPAGNLVDICLLTAGRLDMSIFEKCVKAIAAEMPSVPSRLIVFGNGPIPEENIPEFRRITSSLPPLSRLAACPKNMGFPGGANRAIRSGHAPLVFFISDDIILIPGALDALVKRMDDPHVGLCGMKLLFPEGGSGPAEKVQHVGHGISIRGGITHPFLGWGADNPLCCVSREVASVTGAAFMVRRKIFEAAGGFFEGYGKGYFEDVDLCFAIRKMGLKVFIDAEAQAYHYTGMTMKDEQLPPLQFNEMILHVRHPDGFYWSEYEMY